MLINKNEFVEIINRLKNYNDLKDKIDNLFRELVDNTEQDFCNAGSICIGHESVVVNLLEKMFETDLISWWIYELNYGKRYKAGCLTTYDNREINVSTPENLYDVLIKDLKEKEKNKSE